MARVRFLVCTLLLVCPVVFMHHDDDFAFDNSEDDVKTNRVDIGKNVPRRLWGVPDTSAYVGHLFRMEIPKEAFTGENLIYKIRSEDGRRTPGWLAVDSRHGLISGVPHGSDLGVHTFTVTARGASDHHTATDTFTIEVKKADEKPHSKYGSCKLNENRLVLSIMVDTPFHRIPQRHRIRALMDLAKFMALEWDEFWIEPYRLQSSKERIVLMKGPSARKQNRGEDVTAIYLNVGCSDKLWTRHRVLVAGIREQYKDGTLSQVLSLPVSGWKLLAVKPAPRLKRQLPVEEGSGYDYDDEDPDYSGNDEYDDDEYGRADFGAASDVIVDLPPSPSPHPHRHHHGEPGPPAPGTPLHTTFQTEMEVTAISTDITSTPSNPIITITSTVTSPTSTVTVTSPPTFPSPTTEEIPIVVPAFEETTRAPATSTNVIVTEDDTKVKIEPFSESPSEATSINASIEPFVPRSHGPVLIVPQTEPPPTTEPELQTVNIRPSNEIPIVATASSVSVSAVTPPSPTSASTVEDITSSWVSVSTTPIPSSATLASSPKTPVKPMPTPPMVPSTRSTSPDPEIIIPETTAQETIPSSERSSTIFGRTTETITFAMPVNQPPMLNHHMKKLATTAGKAFRYIIPANMFIDPEDGTNLTFTMYEADNVPLGKNSWIQFMPEDREVYGLPLETHVSKWHFTVEARDSEGAVARAPLDITVQEHKSKRTFNHEFVMQFKVVKPYSYAIDWQIRALEGIVNLFRDTDMDHLTVLNVSKTDDLFEFVWTNDTLPKDICPTEDINRLMKIVESEDNRGDPSAGLARAMSPELKVSSVSWRGVGACASTVGPRAPDTYPPVTRNQVDLLTASVGHLLVYRVPEDTFFDPEDGSTRNLKLSLRFSDRSEIPDGHWLQFDAKNQEFYGLPTSSDEGHMQYQLVAEDSSNKSAYDSLIVEVVKAPSIAPTVEFHMTMEYPYSQLGDNAATKRKVVEKLAALFDQGTTDNIRVHSITEDPTTIVWYNTSLPMDRCPKQEIEELRRMIIVDERGSAGGALKENVDVIFDKDFKVMSIRLVPLGLCAEQHTKTTRVQGTPVNADTKSQKTKSVSSDGYTEYLMTFVIPTVVIVCMILVAGIIACVLYRRRKTARRRLTGKMSVGDEEERQAFRSKGIPVIFQDELEERGDAEPVHKSPVIMREEKPPLLPPAPDYRSDDAPYRPPPPFAASHTPPRPKATPTYRKPPPYVPP